MKLPWVGDGLSLLRNPTAFFEHERQRRGDTFTVDAFGFRLFCVFSPMGVKALYGFAERDASFGLATYRLIGFKLPPELLDGRRNTPHSLFGAQDVERYLDNLDAAIAAELDELGQRGSFEVFTEMRRLGHRLGLASWAGSEVASARYLDRLIPELDAVDSSEAFVRPAQAFRTRITKQRRERQALARIETIIAEVIDERRRAGTLETKGDFLDHIFASFADLPSPEREINTARDIVLIHSGAQSNLYAALAWTLIRVIQHPVLLAAIRDGDLQLLEQCANESIRMAQRSITLREVLRPIDVELESGSHHLERGVFLTTMLSVNNVTAAGGLDTFDPDHYQRGRRTLADPVLSALPTKEVVSTFGHGPHSCPAARFSISAIRGAVRALVDRYDLEPQFREVQPRARQIGGVARAAKPCVVAYSAR